MTRNREIELLKRATLFSLTLHAWGNRHKASMENVDVKNKDWYNFTKKLISCPEYDAIKKVQGELYWWVSNRSMPSFIRKGVYVVALTEVAKYNQKLEEASREIAERVESLIAVLPKAKREAQKQLGSDYREEDYPTDRELRASFGIEWSWWSFGVSENLPNEIRMREAEKLQARYKEAETEIVAALRAGTAELIDYMIGRLQVEPGEKAPVMKEAMVERFNEFVETFNAKNFMDDVELSNLITKAKAIMSGVRVDKLKDRPQMRASIAKGFKELKGQADKLVGERPSRQLDLED